MGPARKEIYMETPKIFESEYRFCLILWEHEPIGSTKLAKLCNEKLGWSRTTTYTVIRRLSDRGVVKNENAIVTSLVSKNQVQAAEIDEMVEKTFEGSVPAFLAAFTRRKALSREEVNEIRKMLDQYDADGKEVSANS
jgi:BlaI family penicillinase repressor